MGYDKRRFPSQTIRSFLDNMSDILYASRQEQHLLTRKKRTPAIKVLM
jgi:hypothetical protein